jgi:hypothetical protein
MGNLFKMKIRSSASDCKQKSFYLLGKFILIIINKTNPIL